MALHNTCLKMTIIGLSVQNIRTNRYILHTHDVDGPKKRHIFNFYIPDPTVA